MNGGGRAPRYNFFWNFPLTKPENRHVSILVRGGDPAPDVKHCLLLRRFYNANSTTSHNIDFLRSEPTDLNRPFSTPIGHLPGKFRHMMRPRPSRWAIMPGPKHLIRPGSLAAEPHAVVSAALGAEHCLSWTGKSWLAGSRECTRR